MMLYVMVVLCGAVCYDGVTCCCMLWWCYMVLCWNYGDVVVLGSRSPRARCLTNIAIQGKSD